MTDSLYTGYLGSTARWIAAMVTGSGSWYEMWWRLQTEQLRVFNIISLVNGIIWCLKWFRITKRFLSNGQGDILDHRRTMFYYMYLVGTTRRIFTRRSEPKINRNSNVSFGQNPNGKWLNIRSRCSKCDTSSSDVSPFPLCVSPKITCQTFYSRLTSTEFQKLTGRGLTFVAESNAATNRK